MSFPPPSSGDPHERSARAPQGDDLFDAIEAIGQVAAQSRDLGELLQGLLRALLDAAPSVDTAAVLLREGDRLRLRATVGLEQELSVAFSLGIGEGFVGVIAAEGRPMELTDAASNPLVKSELLRQRGVRSLYGVPLVHAGQVIGVAHMGSLRQAQFSESDQLLLRSAATAASSAIALHAARADAERRAAQQALVAGLGQRALAGADVDELLAVAVRAVRDGLGVSHASVLELTADGRFVARALEGWPSSLLGTTMSTLAERGHAWFTMETQAPVIVGDFAREPRFLAGAVLRQGGMRSGLSVPIFLGPGRPYGLLSAHSTFFHSFLPERVDFVASIANILGESLARRVEAERLRASEETLRLATEAASLGLWDWDPVSGALSWSPRTREIYGLSPDEPATYEGYVSRLPDADRARMEALVREAMAGKDEGRFRFVHRIVRDDGSTRWLQAHGRAIFDPEGRPVRVLGTTVDITEQKAAEQAAGQASRAKDEFLAMLGHELRNPLAPIVTATQLMRMRDGEVHTHEREVIERQVRHLSRLVDDLLDVSRIAAGRVRLDIETVSIDDVIGRAIETASPLIEERGHRLSVSAPQGLTVRGDPTRLAQVLSNLLTNAAKYTPAGGTIEVDARREDGHAVIRVRDNGSGIRAELLPRVFDLFTQSKQTLDRAHGGLGLGLAIVKSLVALHHGTVEAHSEGEGKGAEFIVRLPAHDAPAHDAPTAPQAPIGPGPGEPHDPRARRTPSTVRVLLVDDNPDALDLLSLALQGKGFVVATADDGPGALALAEQFRPDVAVLDIGLPVIDGYELAARLRRLPGLEALPLVAVTGYGQQRDRDRSRAAGFDLHLVKPVEIAELQLALLSLPPPPA